jgi:xanthine dehydrogenase accessory factor
MMGCAVALDRAGLAAAVARHGTVARVVLAAVAGSVPREAGAAMLVWRDGDTVGQAGTIGGGALEWEAVRSACSLLAGSGDSRRCLVKLPLGPALGQCCGGAATLLVEVFGAAELAAVPEAGAFVRPVAGGRPAADALALRRGAAVLRSGRDGGDPVLAGGWLAETVGPVRRALFLYGAGHVGRAVVEVMAGLDWDITWIDTARARFPDVVAGAGILVAANPADAVAMAPPDATHLVMTFSHALDLEICHRVLSRPLGWLGLIGSATKRARFAGRLRDLGHPKARLDRLVCPIGDPSLGKQPKAIAIGLAHALLSGQVAPESGRIAAGGW